MFSLQVSLAGVCDPHKFSFSRFQVLVSPFVLIILRHHKPWLQSHTGNISVVTASPPSKY